MLTSGIVSTLQACLIRLINTGDASLWNWKTNHEKQRYIVLALAEANGLLCSSRYFSTRERLILRKRTSGLKVQPKLPDRAY